MIAAIKFRSPFSFESSLSVYWLNDNFVAIMFKHVKVILTSLINTHFLLLPSLPLSLGNGGFYLDSSIASRRSFNLLIG